MWLTGPRPRQQLTGMGAGFRRSTEELNEAPHSADFEAIEDGPSTSESHCS